MSGVRVQIDCCKAPVKLLCLECILSSPFFCCSLNLWRNVIHGAVKSTGRSGFRFRFGERGIVLAVKM